MGRKLKRKERKQRRTAEAAWENPIVRSVFADAKLSEEEVFWVENSSDHDACAMRRVIRMIFDCPTDPGARGIFLGMVDRMRKYEVVESGVGLKKPKFLRSWSCGLAYGLCILVLVYIVIVLVTRLYSEL